MNPGGLALGVLALWLATLLVVPLVLRDPVERAAFGQMFGAIGALFTGLAFAAIAGLFARHGRELQQQHFEHSLQREELTRQSHALTNQQDTLALYRQELAAYQEGLALQREQIELLRLEMQRTAESARHAAEEVNQLAQGAQRSAETQERVERVLRVQAETLLEARLASIQPYLYVTRLSVDWSWKTIAGEKCISFAVRVTAQNVGAGPALNVFAYAGADAQLTRVGMRSILEVGMTGDWDASLPFMSPGRVGTFLRASIQYKDLAERWWETTAALPVTVDVASGAVYCAFENATQQVHRQAPPTTTALVAHAEGEPA